MHGWWRFVLGLALTAVATAGVVVAWPDGGRPAVLESGPRTPTTAGAVAFPAGGATDVDASPVDLFAAGASDALAALLATAGSPSQLLEVAVYPEYLIVAYVDPAEPTHIDRRVWRVDRVEGPQPNPIEDRVDAGTQPALFEPAAIDLGRLAAMAADAGTRYSVPVEVTHVLVDRFLPFDERVLVRVYARPADGRSGGGYVSYLPDGTFLAVCC